MKTNLYKKIASSTSFLRILHIVSVNKDNESITYHKLGEEKTIIGEKFHRLLELIDCNKYSPERGRMAMSMRNTHTNSRYVVIDRTFYNEF